jgi:superfamily I DNA/RNA helicase
MMRAENTTVVLGGPGAGKTHKLLSLVEEALIQGVPPERIGYFSFTKRAADEGRSRASMKFNLPPEDFPHFRTLHSFAFKHLGMRRDQMFGWQHVRELGDRLGLEFKGKEVQDGDIYGMASADRMLFMDGLAKNAMRPLQKVWEDAGEDSVDWFELERFSRALGAFKRARMLADFNDLLERLNSCDPRSLPLFDLLLIDEVQDTSLLQWRTIELLAQNAKQIVVCGDDKQSLYEWSGADVATFIGLPGKQVTLEQSYRVPRAPHALASEISDRIGNKRPGRWLAKPEQGEVNWHSSIGDVDLSREDWIIMARNGYMLNEVEDHLMREGFSFHSVNRDPLKSRTLKIIMAWEGLRKGLEEAAERVLEVLRYVASKLVPQPLVAWLKSLEPSAMVVMGDLLSRGLGCQAIWHESLSRISPTERDFFLAARRRGEPLLKNPRIRAGTAHSMKGAEAAHVLLLTDMSHRCFVNMQENPDCENRVLFTALTRCSKTLNIVSPRTNLCFQI